MSIFSRLLLGGLLAVFLTPSVHADEDDTFNVYLAAGAVRDSNLFRQSTRPESDTIQTTSLTLAFSKPLAQQRFSLETGIVDYRFQHNDYLDYNAINYKGTWNWVLTHRLTGILSLSQNETQNSFVDYQPSTPQTRRNIARTNVNHFGAEWQLGGGWRLLGGLTNNELSNSTTFNAQSSYALNTWEAGGKYLWPAGNYLQLLRREGRGEYKDRALLTFDLRPAPFNPQFDTRFRSAETEARLYVPLSGKSAVNAKLARLVREHDYFSQRDFSATTGRLDYSWQATGLLSLNAGLRRDVSAYQDVASSYYLTNGISLQPSWQISPKVVARINYDWQRRNYEGAIVAGLPERKDTLRTTSVGLDWFPVRWATLSASYQRDTRNSSEDVRDFNANIFSVNARLNF